MGNFFENIHDKTKESAGHVVGQVAGGDARKEAEALGQKVEKGYEDFTGVSTLKHVRDQAKGRDKKTYTPGENSNAETSDAAKAAMEEQKKLIEMLRAKVAGEGGQSAAQAQLQQATDANMRASQSSAAGSRGNRALASQAADRNRALTSQQSVSQGIALGAQEDQTNMGNLMRAMQNAQNMQQRQDEFLQQTNDQSERIAANQINAYNQQAENDAKGWQNMIVSGAGAIFGMPPAVTGAVMNQANPAQQQAAFQGPINQPSYQPPQQQQQQQPMQQQQSPFGYQPTMQQPMQQQNPFGYQPPQQQPGSGVLSNQQLPPSMVESQQIAQMNAYNNSRGYA